MYCGQAFVFQYNLHVYCGQIFVDLVLLDVKGTTSFYGAKVHFVELLFNIPLFDN